jgi:predicted enzyme related to lactoylglutathione lyase
VGGEPGQPVSRDVVGVMAPTSGDRFPADAAARWSVNIWVDDADAIADRAVRLGGNAVVPPYDAPGIREAVLADPQGAVFSVSKLTAGA